MTENSERADAASAPVVSKYTIDGDPRRAGSDDIHIERAKQMDGSVKWAVRRMGDCLNKQGEWEYEPMPSSRDHDFLERCRFDNPEAAFAALEVRTASRPLTCWGLSRFCAEVGHKCRADGACIYAPPASGAARL